MPRYNQTPPTYDNGMVTELQTDQQGRVKTLASADASSVYQTQPAPLPAGTNRSGTATTSAAQLAAANTARQGLTIQNIGANNLGINEIGGTAAIGTAGTYTLTPGSSMRVSTNRAISVIAATGATAYTATEV